MEKTYTASEFYKKVNEDLEFNTQDAIILICAILIASIGLNLNSTPTVIGAMLISPLMTPILAIGISGSVYSVPLFKKAAKMLAMEIGVSLLISILYFWISPISYASDQILSRTSPTVWDVLIAFIGGIAGIIGAQKKDAGNIIPGVAIATALMPPLCTVGYAISAGNVGYALGAAYLFLINLVFIILATILGFSWTSLSKRMRQERQVSRNYQWYFIIAIGLFLIPSLFSAGKMVSDSYQRLTITRFVNEALVGLKVVSRHYTPENRTLTLWLSGEPDLSVKEQLEEELLVYGLKDVQLNVQYIAENDALSTEELLTILEEKLDEQVIEDRITDNEVTSEEVKKEKK